MLKYLFYSIIFVSLFFSNSYGQGRIGDPGWSFDASKYDPAYPDMNEWAKAGVEGGIPFLASADVTKIISATNSAGINNAIEEVLSMGGGQIRLLNGTYTIDKEVYMKSGVRIVGESRDGVVLNITLTGNTSAFIFVSGTQYAGLDNLTIQGGYGVPNDYTFQNVKPEFSVNSVAMQSGTKNCWLDNLKIINSGSSAIGTYRGSHHTVRDCYIERSWNKGVDGNGYFSMNGDSYCLVYNNTVTKMRHFTIGGIEAKYNVVIDNEFEVDVNFHNGDGGHNLVENNSVHLPSEHWWSPFQTGDSSLHQPPGDFNYFYKNSASKNGLTPQSDPDTIYTFQGWDGPVGTDWAHPKDSTFYAVSEFAYIPVNSIDILPTNLTLEKGQTSSLITTVLPIDASNSTYFYSSSNVFVATIGSNNVVSAKSSGIATISARTLHESKTVTCQVKVLGISVSPTEIVLNPGKDTTIVASLFLSDEADATVNWMSSDSDIAAVDSNGVVSGLSLGKAIIYATSNTGNYQDSCQVTVLDPNSVQYIETFENMSLVGWGEETYIGDNGFTWTVDAKGADGYIDTSKCIYFQAKPDQYVLSGIIPGGISSFSVTCKDLWNEANERVLGLYINDQFISSITHNGTEIYEFSVENINIAGDFTIKLVNTSTPAGSDRTIALDNIKWTTFTSPTSINEIDNLPLQFSLKQNYPNPFNPSTLISYQLKHSGEVSLVIFNMLGQKIRTLVDAKQASGTHSVTWNGLDSYGRNLANGVYLYRLKTKSGSLSKKMILLK